MPISSGESFRIEYGPTKGMEMEFYRGNILLISVKYLSNIVMSKHGRTKLIPPKQEPKNQALETSEESNLPEQKEESVVTELDNGIECLYCHEVMKLHSSFDRLMYSCESCSYLLRCI